MILVRKIVPFNNILTFNTDVREITAISLEHDIKTESDSISGVFYISGEYKITDGQLEKEPFNFELPFDIALGAPYNLDTIIVDIDDFRYELIGRNELKINIDLFIDGEIIEEEPVKEENNPKEIKDNLDENETEVEEKSDVEDTREDETIDLITEEPSKHKINESLDLLDEMLENKKEESMEEEKIDININNANENNNEVTNETIDIFNAFNEEEKYVTYRVYRVGDNDTIDSILEKYNISKEELAKYNSLESVKSGDKLIIPANDK